MKSDAVHLPLPRDARAKRIAAMLQKQPSDTRSLIELSKLAGASKRTVERLFKVETGLGFGKWRQQLRLGHALRLLAAGDAGHDGRDGRRLRQHQRVHLGVSHDLRQNPRPVFPRGIVAPRSRRLLLSSQPSSSIGLWG